MENRPININVNSKENIGHFRGEMKRGLELPSVRNAETPRVQAHVSDSPGDNKFIVKALDKILGFSLLAIFFGLPLFFTGLTFQGVVFEKQLYFYFWLLLGLVSWTAKGVILGEMNVARTPLDIPIIGFWLVYLISTFYSIDRWHSFWGAFSDPSRGLMSVTALIIAYYLIVSNFSLKRLRAFLAAIIVSGAVLSVWTALAIRSIQFLPDSLAKYAPVSMSGSIVGLGVLFAGFIPLIVLAILKTGENTDMGKVSRKVILGALFLLLGLDLFLILALYNFVSWIGLFFGIVVFLVFILSRIVRPAANWAWLPMVLFVVIMILRMTGVVQVAKVNFAEVKPLDLETSVSIAKSAVKDNFFLGSGPATYGYNFSLYRPQEFNNNLFYNLRFLQGTGIIMEALPTIGAVGTFFLAVLLLSYLSVGFYLIAREKEKNKLYSLGFFSAAIIFIGAALTTKVEGTVLIFGSLIAAVAISMILYESQTKKNSLSLSLKASPKFALALAFVFMVVSAGVAFLFVFLGKLYVADVYAGASTRVGAEKQDQGNLKMANAIRMHGKEGKYYIQLGTYYMAAANKEALKGPESRDVEKIKQYLNSSIALTNKGKELMKNDVSATEALAQIYENGALYIPDSRNYALETYQKALELEPHNPIYFVKIGQLKVSMAAAKKTEAEKKPLLEEAKNQFESAIREKNNLAEAHDQLALVKNALGDVNGAIENETKAVQFSPKNFNYVLSLGRLFQGRSQGDDLDKAEKLFKTIAVQDEKGTSAVHANFYLGILYEKQKKKQEARESYRKVVDLLPAGENSVETKKQLEKMIANVDAGIENTPQNLGLVSEQNANTPDMGSEVPGGETVAPVDSGIGQ